MGNHTRQHNQIHQQHAADNPKRKHGTPTLTDTILLQPGQGGNTQIRRGIIVDEILAFAVDIAFGAEELDGGADEAGDVEDEQDEAAYHEDAGEEAALDYEEEHEDYEGDCEGADGYAEGHDPG